LDAQGLERLAKAIGVPEEGTADGAIIDRMVTSLGDLSPLAQEVVTRRFGLGGGERELLAAIADEHADLTAERVRQVEAIALRQLETAVRS
jgi:DNA-directed RNA polymerase sigma subunit (sigma70/sigma32)